MIISEPFFVSIYHDLPLLEQIVTPLRVSPVDMDYLKGFPLGTGYEERELFLVSPDEGFSSPEWFIRELERLGYEAVGLSELLAFGAKYSDEAKDGQIIAIRDHHPYIATEPNTRPCLICDDGERRIETPPFDNGWTAKDRFLVRKLRV